MTQTPIAIVGLSAIFPGSIEKNGFWQNICQGKDLIGDIPPNHWLIEDYYDPDPNKSGKTYCQRGAFLSEMAFDPLEFGIPPSSLAQIDTAQLLSLLAAKQVLKDACDKDFTHIDRERCSVVLGTGGATELVNAMVGSLQRPIWVKALREEGLPESQVQAICDRMASNYNEWTETTFPGLLTNVVAGRIANRFDLNGTNCVVDAACASSLAALKVAVSELSQGYSDMVITGGVDALNDIVMFMCFSKTPALSPTGDCRPFSDNADGTMMGEGIGMFALRRLDDAERDGDRIYAVIKGIGSSSDGRSKSIYAPRAEGQAKALRRAYERAGYAPETVGLLEAHGTGTIAGDAAEIGGLISVFGASVKPHCALGSIKSQIGHTKAAAGSASLFKTVMALHHKVLPPTIKINQPNPSLKLDNSPFYLNTRLRPWIRNSKYPRRASVSAFGFGGSNFHVAVEEYQGAGARPERVRLSGVELFLIGEDNLPQLQSHLQSLSAKCAAQGFLATAKASQIAFRHDANCRIAVLASSIEQLQAHIHSALLVLEKNPGQASAPNKTWWYAQTPAFQGKIAFLCPGQGSQYLNMGAEVVMTFATVREIWDQAANQIDGLGDVVFPIPRFSVAEEQDDALRLRATENAQPAIGITSLVWLSLLKAVGVSADCVAGHSFGEVTALHVAGVIGSDDVIAIAKLRGQLMAEASNATQGAMLAVFAVADDINTEDLDVSIANYNSPKQSVFAGQDVSISKLEQRLDQLGIRYKRLSVATAFHTELVAAATKSFRQALQEKPFATPAIPVYANSTAAPYQGNENQLRDLLAGQIAKPVRFVETIEALYQDGVRLFIEIGPGQVLTDLTGQCLPGQQHTAIALDGKSTDSLVGFWSALGALAVLGIPLYWDVLWQDFILPEPETSPASKVSVMIDGSNYQKAYPPAGGFETLPRPNPEPPKEMKPSPEPAASPSAGTNDSQLTHWLKTLESIQQQSAETHRVAQQAMADAHIAYLKTTEALFRQLGNPQVEAPAMPAFTPPLPIAAAASLSPPPEASLLKAQMMPAPEVLTAVTEVPAAMPTARPEPQQAPAPAVNVLQIISDATGFPADMLTPEMELEADLGIDSIKRVEIFAALQTALLNMPAVDTKELGSIRTIGQVSALMGEIGDAKPTPQPVPKVANLPDRSDLLQIISNATGFPADMLTSEMELEADLGIDSIKRVEIFAAIQTSFPDLPSIDTGELATLRTIGSIVQRLQQNDVNSAVSSPRIKPEKTCEAKPEALDTTPNLHRSGLIMQAEPASGFAMLGLYQGLISIIGDPVLSKILAAELDTLGFNVRAEQEVSADSKHLIILAGLGQDAEQYQQAALSAFNALHSFAAQAQNQGGAIVLIQHSDGAFGTTGQQTERAWLAGFAGLSKTAALEWPLARLKCIDTELDNTHPDLWAKAVATELLAGGITPEVGLKANGERLVPVEIPLALPADANCPLPADAVLVVSGGARGVTAACLIALAKKMPGLRFALLGRSNLSTDFIDLPNTDDEAVLRQALAAKAKAQGQSLTPKQLAGQAQAARAVYEISATLSALKAQGAKALYLPCDIGDQSAVRTTLDKVRLYFGRIDGIIHAAGVLKDRLISDKTPEQFAAVVHTKVQGLRALLKATANDDLRLIMLFSSVAARYGNPGQCDYAFANETLNKVAYTEAARRGDQCLVRSINWGPWQGGMVTQELAAMFKSHGVGLIDLQQGAAAFVAELSAGTGQNQCDIVLAADVHKPAVAEMASLELMVDCASPSYAFLNDHCIQGVPVVPIALVCEWFARALKHWQADAKLLELQQIRLHKGILLTQASRLKLNGICKSEGLWELSLSNADSGELHYSGLALLASAGTSADEAISLPKPPATPWQKGAFYGQDALFHGSGFVLIHSVEGMNASGICGTLERNRPRQWQDLPWALDVGLIDGALQLAFLWGQQVINSFSLPSRIERLLIHDAGLAKGLATAVLQGQAQAPYSAQSDITIMAGNGQPLLSLIGFTQLAVNQVHGTKSPNP